MLRHSYPDGVYGGVGFSPLLQRHLSRLAATHDRLVKPPCRLLHRRLAIDILSHVQHKMVSGEFLATVKRDPKLLVRCQFGFPRVVEYLQALSLQHKPMVATCKDG